MVMLRLTSTDKVQAIEPNFVGIGVFKKYLLYQTCIDICMTLWQVVYQEKR